MLPYLENTNYYKISNRSRIKRISHEVETIVSYAEREIVVGFKGRVAFKDKNGRVLGKQINPLYRKYVLKKPQKSKKYRRKRTLKF